MLADRCKRENPGPMIKDNSSLFTHTLPLSSLYQFSSYTVTLPSNLKIQTSLNCDHSRSQMRKEDKKGQATSYQAQSPCSFHHEQAVTGIEPLCMRGGCRNTMESISEFYESNALHQRSYFYTITQCDNSAKSIIVRFSHRSSTSNPIIYQLISLSKLVLYASKTYPSKAFRQYLCSQMVKFLDIPSQAISAKECDENFPKFSMIGQPHG